MNKKIFQILFFLIVVIAFAVVIKNFVDSITSDINEYSHVIRKQPSSSISRLAPIVIKLSQDIDDDRYPINEPITEEIVSFKPTIEGYTYFTDKRTIEFQPNEPLPDGTLYSCKFDIVKVFTSLKIKPFRFKFSTPKLTFNVHVGKISYYDSTSNDYPNLNGQIVFNDYVDYNKITDIVTAHQNGIELPIDFIPSKNYQKFKFVINKLQRSVDNESVVVAWNGKPIDSEIVDSVNVNIIPVDLFKMANYSFSYFPTPTLKMQFADIINAKLFTDSLIIVSQLADYNIYVVNNEVRVIFKEITNRTHDILISKFLQNESGIRLEEDVSFLFKLTNALPSISIKDSSYYKSKSKESSFIDVDVFNLTSLSVEVTHVPDKNMVQFLQVNNINGNKELKRVGKSIYKNTFNLQTSLNYAPDKITTYNLNLLGTSFSESGLYNFTFRYNNNNIVYHDSTVYAHSSIAKNLDGEIEAFSNNVVFSDLHIVAKRTELDTLYVFVSSSVTSKPVKQSYVEVFDFQQNQLATLFTDAKGVARVLVDKKELFIRVKHKNQIAYLKVDEQNTIFKSEEELVGMSSNKGVMFHVTGLKPIYTLSDSLKVGVVLKQNGKHNLEKKNLVIKLKSPTNKFYNTKVSQVSNLALTVYKTKFPYNSESGIWRVVISYDKSTLEFPFVFENRDYYFTDSLSVRTIDCMAPMLCDSILINDSVFQFGSDRRSTSNLSANSNEYNKSSVYISVNKTSYAVGDTCIIELSSINSIQGLLTFENSTDVFYSKMVNAEKDNNKISVVLTDDMLPGLHIVFLPTNSCKGVNAGNYISIVNSFNDNLDNLEFDMPYDWLANSRIPISVSNISKNVLNYFIYISSDTSNFNKSPLLNFFQNKQHNGINTWSSNCSNKKGIGVKLRNNIGYRYVSNNSDLPNNTQLLLGPFSILREEKSIHYIDVPESKGVVNVRLLGIEDRSGKMFDVIKSAEISENISFTTDVPKYVFGSDIVQLQAKIGNNKLDTDTLFVEVTDLKNFEILSPLEERVIVPKDSVVVFSIIVKAKNIEGDGKFIISSSSHKQSFSRKVSIPIQRNAIGIDKSISTVLPPQLTWQQTIKPVGIRGTNNSTIEISDSDIPNILQTLKVLDKNSSSNLSYIINKNFSLIYMSKLIDDKELVEKYKEGVNDALVQIIKYQKQNGSFVDKFSDLQSSATLTSYVGDFMLEAKKNGYIVNQGLFNKWYRYQQSELHKIMFSMNRCNVDNSFLLLTLAKSDLLQKKQIESYALGENYGLVDVLYIALAYSELGYKKQAIQLVNFDSLKSVITRLNIVESALLLDISDELSVSNMSSELINHINSLIKYRTNTPNEIVLALNSILKSIYISKVDSDVKLDYHINHGGSNDFESTSLLSYIDIPLEFTLPKYIDVVNNSDDTLYLNLSNSGSPQKILSSYSKYDKLTISNRYVNLNNLPIDMHNIKVGSFYKQIISYENIDRKRNQVLSVSIPMPAGVELLYSNVPILFNEQHNKNSSLLKTEFIIHSNEVKNIELIFKTLTKGIYHSHSIKTCNIYRYYFEKYTLLPKLYIK